MQKKKRQMIAPVVVTAVIVLYELMYVGWIMALVPGIWKWALAIVPLLGVGAMIAVCRERMQEIRKGEEDDLGQY